MSESTLKCTFFSHALKIIEVDKRMAPFVFVDFLAEKIGLPGVYAIHVADVAMIITGD